MRLFALALLLILPLRAIAEPAVVASIAPVHSLTAQVMRGMGEPHLLLPPGVSPHDHALRPSDAAALARADVVIQIGDRLEPWLKRPLETLAGRAQVVRLAEMPGVFLLDLREGAVFGDHAHEGHTDAADPHLWLDPENAKHWLYLIAHAISQADPANRETYWQNADAARAELDQLSAEITANLASVRHRPFIVLHDAFHYFENRFEIEASGAIALSDARAPGPARIAEIRAHIRASGAVCLFGEPQMRAPLVATVAEGTGVRIGTLDPLGAGLEPGPELYAELLTGLAESLENCLR
jgi:zinc transport system substrate-binding protein